MTSEKKWISNISYNKKGLFNDKLAIKAYLVGVSSDNISKDISDYVYDWHGNKTINADPTKSETDFRKTYLTLSSKNLLANTNIEYQLTDYSNFAFSYSFNYIKLKGEDDYKEENNTQFSNPTTLKKQVYAIAFTNSLLDEKLKSTVFAKSYNYNLNSLETNYTGTETSFFEQTKQYLGLGFSTTYKWEKLQLKASFEKAVRFPEIIELYGNGLTYGSTPGLLPEKSNNYNLGAIYKTEVFQRDIILSLNTFVRDATNFIHLNPGIPMSYYYNIEEVLSKGIDLAANYKISNNLLANINITYIDLRHKKIRLPNEPYFFGNMSVSYKKKEIFKRHDDFSVTLNQNYVHSFYNKWPHLGDKDKGVIPKQWVTNLDIVYSLENGKYNASFGISNLWDAKVYDNFEQLKPGRAYNIKIRYFIN
ncbi:MAG: hypothetical protein HRT66_01770 [Flavobacteriaceae bacterium]|nr:hypothetical protein [Flavobacteriaceae bacterium]